MQYSDITLDEGLKIVNQWCKDNGRCCVDEDKSYEILMDYIHKLNAEQP